MINKPTSELKLELKSLREDIYSNGFAYSSDVETHRRIMNTKLQREQWLMMELIMRKLRINF